MKEIIAGFNKIKIYSSLVFGAIGLSIITSILAFTSYHTYHNGDLIVFNSTQIIVAILFESIGIAAMLVSIIMISVEYNKLFKLLPQKINNYKLSDYHDYMSLILGTLIYSIIVFIFWISTFALSCNEFYNDVIGNSVYLVVMKYTLGFIILPFIVLMIVIFAKSIARKNDLNYLQSKQNNVDVMQSQNSIENEYKQ